MVCQQVMLQGLSLGLLSLLAGQQSKQSFRKQYDLGSNIVRLYRLAMLKTEPDKPVKTVSTIHVLGARRDTDSKPTH